MIENQSYKYKLSIITATYNAQNHLHSLIECLRNQEDKDFEWVIADGASTDGTLELLRSITDLNIKITSQKDFGIYDALNRGIQACNGEFYLVIGADDFLYPNAVKDYKDAIGDDVDVVTAKVEYDKKMVAVGSKPSWLVGQFAYVSGHSVGTIFRKSLHDKYGLYSRKLPIAADQLFILTIAKAGVNILKIDKTVGKFNLIGVSSVDLLGTLTEFYRCQIMTGENKLIQTLLLGLRLIKYITKL